jgi:hypothetical protein
VQQQVQQTPELSSVCGQLGNLAITIDSQTGRPQVLVDLAIFQALLQRVGIAAAPKVGGSENLGVQQEARMVDAHLQHEMSRDALWQQMEGTLDGSKRPKNLPRKPGKQRS